MYTWHVTLRDAPQLQQLAAAARERLAGLPGLDLVPGQWLHLTTQDIGFTDEVSEGDLAAITDAARARLARVPPPTVVIGPPHVLTEGIGCDAVPAAALSPARDAVRAAVGDVLGPDRVPGNRHWWPHVSVGYANAAGPSGAFEAALTGFTDVARVTVPAIQLIRLGRDQHVYEWETCATVPLGG
jgi:2'-5' RNA ligase superfamily